jgi:hypothetical protein
MATTIAISPKIGIERFLARIITQKVNDRLVPDARWQADDFALL